MAAERRNLIETMLTAAWRKKWKECSGLVHKEAGNGNLLCMADNMEMGHEAEEEMSAVANLRRQAVKML